MDKNVDEIVERLGALIEQAEREWTIVANQNGSLVTFDQITRQLDRLSRAYKRLGGDARPTTTSPPATEPEPVDEGTGAIEVWTDGGCVPNPGPGGWGAVIVAGEEVREMCGHSRGATTNNAMELTAVIKALLTLDPDTHAVVYADSKYVVNGIQTWIAGWKRKGWKTKTGDEVKNRQLWETLAGECDRLRVDAVWVRGHAGKPHNERAHELARLGRLRK